MRFGINSQLFRKAALWIAPLGLLSATTLHAQWASPYGYDDGYATRYHQKHEKRDLKEHQREERRYYGDSWELRQHQQDERHQLRHHQRDERNYGDGYRFRDQGGYYDRGGSYGRRY